MTVKGRFAPTPSGRMHLGNLLSALLAWLDVRSVGGELVLRIEDLDTQRTSPDFAAQLMDDLRWLGLDWDEGPETGGPDGPYFQSRRTALYQAALEKLEALLTEMKSQPLPDSREEFEARAILFYILMQVRQFLEIKREFVLSHGQDQD